ncbi:MAG: hypothetical protein ACRBN8_30855 [Nannocystales bacterium]
MRNGSVLTLCVALLLSCNGSKSSCTAGPPPVEHPPPFPVVVPGLAARPLVVHTPDALPQSAASRAEVTGLAMHGSELYVVDSVRGVLRTSLTDGTTEELANLDRPFARPTVTTGRLYGLGDDDLVSVPTEAGDPLSVVQRGLLKPRDLAVKGSYAYVPTGQWFGRGPGEPEGKIVRVSLSGGARSDLATGQPGPVSVAVDNEHVYWTCQGAVMRVSVAGGSPERFAEFEDDYPWHIVLDQERVYTMVQSGLGVGLYRMPKSDATPLRLAHLETMPPGLALGDGAVHFVAESEQPNIGTLWRLDLRDARLDTVATGIPPSCCVVADDRHLAWASGRDVLWMEHKTHEVHRAPTY